MRRSHLQPLDKITQDILSQAQYLSRADAKYVTYKSIFVLKRYWTTFWGLLLYQDRLHWLVYVVDVIVAIGSISGNLGPIEIFFGLIASGNCAVVQLLFVTLPVTSRLFRIFLYALRLIL